jgi:hypothetical protein
VVGWKVRFALNFRHSESNVRFGSNALNFRHSESNVRFGSNFVRYAPNFRRSEGGLSSSDFDPNQTLVEEEKIPAAPRVCFWCDWARANGNRSAFPYNPAPYGVNVTGHASAFLLTSIENISFRPRTSLKATVRMCWAI